MLEPRIQMMSDATATAQCERGLDLLAAGSPAAAADEFRAAIAADPAHHEAHHGLVRALRDAGEPDQAVAAALKLIALTPNDPLAYTALSITLQAAGRVPEAEAAAARARILEWKMQLQTPPDQNSLNRDSLKPDSLKPDSIKPDSIKPDALKQGSLT
jgi:Flp pilus assembly protein TadD